MGGGVWEFRPETRRAEILSKGLINPWGFEFDRWGQSFATDGAGSEGVNYIFPQSVFATSRTQWALKPVGKVNFWAVIPSMMNVW